MPPRARNALPLFTTWPTHCTPLCLVANRLVSSIDLCDHFKLIFFFTPTTAFYRCPSFFFFFCFPLPSSSYCLSWITGNIGWKWVSDITVTALTLASSSVPLLLIHSTNLSAPLALQWPVSALTNTKGFCLEQDFLKANSNSPAVCWQLCEQQCCASALC